MPNDGSAGKEGRVTERRVRTTTEPPPSRRCLGYAQRRQNTASSGVLRRSSLPLAVRDPAGPSANEGGSGSRRGEILAYLCDIEDAASWEAEPDQLASSLARAAHRTLVTRDGIELFAVALASSESEVQLSMAGADPMVAALSTRVAAEIARDHSTLHRCPPDSVMVHIEECYVASPEPGTSSALETQHLIPIVAGRIHHGFLYVGSRRKDALELADLTLLFTLASRIARALCHQLELRQVHIEQMEQMVHGMSHGVVMLDPEGQPAIVNPPARRLLSIITQRTVDSNAALMGAIESSVALAALASGCTPTREFAVEGDDGSNTVVKVTCSTVRDPRQGEIGRVLVLDDITSERAALRHLAHSERLATIGTLVAGVSHEMNNPLAAVRGNASLLSGTWNPWRARKLARRIDQAAQRCTSIVSNLLTFSRSHESDSTEFDLRAATRQALEILAYRIRRSHTQVVASLDMPVTVRGDAARFQQVIINLVSNAIDAMEAHETRGPRVDIEVGFVDGAVRLVVADNGPGVPRHLRDRIFDPFYTTKPVDRGTGLGLSISYGIIKEMHGNLHLADTPDGSGATFVIELEAL